MGKKSYAIGTPLKGPPAPKEWWSYKRSGACPVVIERKLKYVVTHLDNLAKVEKLLAEEQGKPEVERHPRALGNLRQRLENKQQWLDYSVQVLRNCVRFALARIEHDSEDHQLLVDLRAKAGMPYKSKTGRTNKKQHEKLRYYAKVLDQYLLAKTAVSGTSLADDAMKDIWKLCQSTIFMHKRKSGREDDDAEQQAALGILKACEAYEPGKDGKFAQFGTFAAWKIRRATQARKTSHCKPGRMIEGGKNKAIHSIDAATDRDDSGADAFHPEATTKNKAVIHDVQSALAALPDDLRGVAEDALLYGRKAPDIAERTGETVSQVRYKIRKAKTLLAEMLAEHRPG